MNKKTDNYKIWALVAAALIIGALIGCIIGIVVVDKSAVLVGGLQ